MTLSFSTVDPGSVHGWITGDDEIAFIDLQEVGQHGLAHPLLASNIPFSRLEAEIGFRVPRKSTRIVLIDAGDGVSERAALRLAALGYTDLSVLSGGTAGWSAAGYELFDGTNVPSKAFAEVLEVQWSTPHISAQDFDKLRASGEKVVLLDNRTPEEFSNFHVPGARSVPGIELVARAHDYIPDDETLVVVSCAGRTRSIIGAQGLINFRIPNRIVSLEGGTQGWRLAGLTLEHTTAEPIVPLSDPARELAIERAEVLRRDHEIAELSPEDFDKALNAPNGRSVFVFDVRTHEDYLTGHHPAARWVPGGQLVQTLDQCVSVINSKLILIDDDRIRATVAAHWLTQLGWDVSVVTLSSAQLSAVGPSPSCRPTPTPDIESIAASAASDWLGAEGRIIHAGSSADYLSWHPEGAIWVIRPRLDEVTAELTDADKILVVGDGDLVSAKLVAGDLARAGIEVRILKGGTDAWESSGLPVTRNPAALEDKNRIDFLFWLSRRHQDDFAGMRAYLDWELDLPARIARDGTAKFRIPEPGLTR